LPDDQLSVVDDEQACGWARASIARGLERNGFARGIDP
jgi:hypothetical protein